MSAVKGVGLFAIGLGVDFGSGGLAGFFGGGFFGFGAVGTAGVVGVESD